MHAGRDQLLGRVKRLRAEFLRDGLGADGVRIRYADEFDLLGGVFLQVAVDTRVITAKRAAANHSDAQGAVFTGHGLILADSAGCRQRRIHAA